LVLETGTVLNNIYRVVKLLGKGAMGNVYLVERIKDDRKLVVKELLFPVERGLDTETAKEIFFREAEFMVKFDHPGLPKMYGIFSQDGREYIAMDYIEGKTLEEIINSSEVPVDTEKAINWTVKLAEIMDYLHNSFEKPVIYRDLKPSNIIITPENGVKLVDFGIARYYNPDKDTDTFSYGSPGYAAPEQYKGRGQSGPQSDIFGLGVILFQMLTGYDPTLKPFTFPDMQKMNPHISDNLKNIINRAIETDPVKRYISMAEFKENLEKIMPKKINFSYLHQEEEKATNKWALRGIYFGVATIILPFIFVFLIRFTADAGFIKYCFIFPLILVICNLAGIYSSIGSKQKALANPAISYNLSLTAITLNLLLFCPVIFTSYFLYDGYMKSIITGRLASCESNLKNIATAVEIYKENNEGLYPPSLEMLESKDINKLPECRASKKGYEYVCNNETNHYSIWCPVSQSHIDTGTVNKDGCWPQYNPSEGIRLK